MDDELTRGLTRVARREGLRLMVLFGSAVRGDGREPEDLDIAVDAGGPVDTVHLTNVLARELGRDDVDLVDLRRADPVVLMAVAEEGVLIHPAEPAVFRAFQSLAARRFYDTRKLRDAERDHVRDALERLDPGADR